jgi:hypothetical protein
MNNDDGEFSEAEEEKWVVAQRSEVATFLSNEGINQGEISEWPAWFIQPHLAIFAIESGVAKGRMSENSRFVLFPKLFFGRSWVSKLSFC